MFFLIRLAYLYEFVSCLPIDEHTSGSGSGWYSISALIGGKVFVRKLCSTQHVLTILSLFSIDTSIGRWKILKSTECHFYCQSCSAQSIIEYFLLHIQFFIPIKSLHYVLVETKNTVSYKKI